LDGGKNSPANRQERNNMSKLTLIEMSVDVLVPYEKNARKHPEAQIQQIAQSIKDFGFLSPVLIDKENNIVCGHGRVMAAKKLAMHTVPCLRVDSLTEGQRRAFILIENRLHETSDWDRELLKHELDDLMLNLQMPLENVGFSPDEITALLGGPLSLSGGQPEDFPEANEDIETKHECPKCGYKWS
jgi:ParB-like chromosome segregation protein Spo0J